MAKLEQHLDALLDDYRRGYTPLPNDDFAFERDARALQGRLLARVAPDDFDDFSAALDVGVDLPDDESGETRLVCVNNFPEFIQYYLRFRLRQCFRQFVDERREKVKTIEDADWQKHADEDFPPAAAEGFGSPATIPEDLSNEYSTPHLHFLRPKSERKSPQKNRIVLKATVAFALAVATALTIVGIAKIAEEGPPTAKKKTDDPLQKKDKMTSETRRQLEAETRLIEKSANEPRQQAVAYEMRSRTFLSIGYHAEAIADLQSAIRLMEAGLGDDRVDATRNQLMRTEHMIGNIYKSVSGYPQAIAAYDRAIAYATAPQRHTKAHDALFIYQDRAQSKQRMNRWSDALQDCVLAIESDNGFPDAIHATLAKDVALCLRGLGREAEARQWDKITAEYEDNADSSYRQIRALLPTLKRKP